MKNIVSYIHRHLSLRLGLLILLLVGAVFGVAITILFHESRQVVRKTAFKHAAEALDESVHNISAIIDQTEAAAVEVEQQAREQMNVDSLMAITRRVLGENSSLQSIFIAFEPDVFPELGRLFVAFSYREGDSIITSYKTDYDYLDHAWYAQPLQQKKDCWLEPYWDELPGISLEPQYFFSYVKPLYQRDNRLIGIVCCDLSLRWLSLSATAVKPFPHSSAIMLSHDGSYIVHPDTLKVARESIFSDPDPEAVDDVILLGNAMLAGQNGSQELVVDGNAAHVFYRPLKHTGWSIAIVSPDSDVFGRYKRIYYSVWAFIGISLFLLLLFCYQIIRQAIVPLNRLARQTRYIADGHFDEELLPSRRSDTVGHLQNSFLAMQQSLQRQMSEIQQMNQQLEQHNQELQQAYRHVSEAHQRKGDFVQDMAHQIRTPLNIISGFTQVIATNLNDLPASEFDDITSRMKSSASAISRISRMLVASSADTEQLMAKYTTFACNELCHEVVAAMGTKGAAKVSVVSAVADDFTISTNRETLTFILSELLDNAARFAGQGDITLGCRQGEDDTVMFTVTDTGPGIDRADRDRIFTRFTKLDSFSEGIGLGLPLCRHLMLLLGGQLVLDDSYTDGARFIIVLPRQLKENSINL